MTYIINYNLIDNVIEVKVHEVMTSKEILDLMFEVAQISKEKECGLFLGDYREATARLSTLEIYELPKKLLDMITSLGLHPYQLKRAIVVKQDLEDYAFFETVSFNRGQNVRVFQEFDLTKNWLFGK